MDKAQSTADMHSDTPEMEREDSAASLEALLKKERDQLKQELKLITDSLEASKEWSGNAFKIFGLELKQFGSAMPEYVLSRLVFGMMQIVTWTLLVMCLVYVAWVLTGSIGIGLLLALGFHGLGCLAFWWRMNRLKRSMSFEHSRKQLRTLAAALTPQA